MEKDVLVIGGGINGVGVAADLAGRGLAVVLCEMGDLASGTSSASSRLIHGGLRYLENFEFGLVRESLQERSILRTLAPHLVKLQPFVMPHLPWLRPYWLLRAGLFMYDHLASDPRFPASTSLNANQISDLELKLPIDKALRYYDCTEDDSRLTVHVALLAKQHGAEILPRTQVVSTQRADHGWQVVIKNTVTNESQNLHVKVIVNAAGPWVQQVANDILNISTKQKMKLVKGSHIIVPRLFTHDQAFILQNQDQRVVFLIPYLADFTLIGTTEVVLEKVEQPINISTAELEYLCDLTNQFVTRPITPNDVINQYAGIRPLHDDKNNLTRKVSRDYALDVNDDIENAPAISIFGGKITTYRHLAEKVGDMLHKYFPHAGPAWTKTAFLPGGDFLNADVDGYTQVLIAQYPNIPANLLQHYVNTYGTRTMDLLLQVTNISSLGQHFGALLYQLEVDYLIAHEWAQTVEDILWRRGKQGLWLNTEQVRELELYIAKY